MQRRTYILVGGLDEGGQEIGVGTVEGKGVYVRRGDTDREE